jgi:acetyl esterase
VCRRLADLAGCVVVSVHYRRAPEDRFPAAVDDAVAAYGWVCDHAGELGVLDGVVGVMGDSAGANLSAAVCLEARRLGLAQPVAQGLVYPLVDARLRFESYQTFADGFGLSLAGIELYRDTYARDRDDWVDPRMSPLCADDLTGLAPALVVTAGFDPLRDDGRAYADALAGAGVPVTYRCYDDMMHGFQAMLVLDAARAASDEISSAMGDLMWAAAADRAGGVS